MLYRRVAPLIREAGRVDVDLGELSRNLGLGSRAGPNSAVLKALNRLEQFHLGEWRHPDRYALRRAVAPISNRQAQRLPEPARTIHYRTLRHSPTAATSATACLGKSRPRP